MRSPETSYGVLEQDGVQWERERAESSLGADPVLRLAVTNLREDGFAVFDPEISVSELDHLSTAFDRAHEAYLDRHGREKLKMLDETNTIRAMLMDEDPAFLGLALNSKLLKLIGSLISGKFILNQQNGIINPPKEPYNQAHWHRDLPYQHFVSSRPLAINALFCIDEFNAENGATFVLPKSHKVERFPSWEKVRENARQVSVPRGSFVVLDCMTFHAGGYNSTSKARRAINHVYSIPLFKQQIGLGAWFAHRMGSLDPQAREVLGLRYLEPQSVEAYIQSRVRS